MEPVGIYSTVSISRSQLDQFYADSGNLLIDDVRCIMGKKEGLRPEYRGFHDPATGYYHSEQNKLVVRYDEATETLFYLYQLELRDPESMAEALSFKVFTDISKYRHALGPDFIVFSPSSPNFLIDEPWRVYEFASDGIKEIPVTDIPKARMRQMDALSWQYYWGPIEAMFQRSDLGEDVSYFNHFFPQNCIDPQLLSLLGIPSPTEDPRMAPSPYPK